jgi:hypothetical protein
VSSTPICDWTMSKGLTVRESLRGTVLLGHVSVRNAMLRPPGVFKRRA